MATSQWDLVIVGAGPAGLAAALYGSRSGLSTLLLEEKTAGGLLSEIPFVENYLGFPEGIAGLDLAAKMSEQAKKAGAEIHEIEAAKSATASDKAIVVETDRANYVCRTLILATGGTHRPLGAKGEEKLRGRGVSYCALCDGAFFKGKIVAVVGGGNSAAASALYLSGLANRVYLVHRRAELRAEDAMIKAIKDRGVEIVLNREILEIRGDSRLRSILTRDKSTNETFEMEVDGLFVEVGEIPNSELARRLGVKLDEEGFVLVDDRQETNVQGVFAAGDVTAHSVKQISTAVAQGVVAATEAYAHVRRPYYRRP